MRVASFLYDNGVLNEVEGPSDVREFLESRWRGIRPVVNGMAAEQVEMMEALHCGLFGLEQSTDQTHG